MVYAKATWERLIKQIGINFFSVAAMLEGFDQTWDARNILCRRNYLKVAWDWKRQRSSSLWWIIWWFEGCPWQVGWGLSLVRWFQGGCLWWSLLMLLLRGGVSHPRGLASSHGGRVFLVHYAFGVGFVGISSKKKKKKKIW